MMSSIRIFSSRFKIVGIIGTVIDDNDLVFAIFLGENRIDRFLDVSRLFIAVIMTDTRRSVEDIPAYARLAYLSGF